MNIAFLKNGINQNIKQDNYQETSIEKYWSYKGSSDYVRNIEELYIELENHIALKYLFSKDDIVSVEDVKGEIYNSLVFPYTFEFKKSGHFEKISESEIHLRNSQGLGINTKHFLIIQSINHLFQLYLELMGKN